MNSRVNVSGKRWCNAEMTYIQNNKILFRNSFFCKSLLLLFFLAIFILNRCSWLGLYLCRRSNICAEFASQEALQNSGDDFRDVFL